MSKLLNIKIIIALILTIELIATHGVELETFKLQKWLRNHLQNEGIHHVIFLQQFPDQKDSLQVNELCFFLNNQGVSTIVTYATFPSILTQRHHARYLIITKMKEIQGLLLNSYASIYFIENDWLLLKDQIDSWSQFENVKGLRQNSRLYVYVSHQGIFEVYRPQPQAPIISSMLYDSNLTKMTFDTLHDRRRDLYGLKLKLTYIPINYFDPINKTGMYYSFLETISRDLNFTFELIRPDDNEFGNVKNGSTFNGMIGQVQRNEADFSPMIYTISKVRSEAVDFSIAISESFIQLYFNTEKLQNFHSNSWDSLFEPRFWYKLGGLLFIFFMYLCIMLKICGVSHDDIGYNRPLHSIFIVLFSFMGREPQIQDPKRASKRVFFVTMSLFGAVVSWSYHAHLISILTSSKVDFPIKKFEDLLKYREYNMILLNGSSMYDEFKTADALLNPIYYNIYQELIRNRESEIIFSRKKAKELLKNEKNYIALVEEYSQVFDCNLDRMDEIVGKNHLAWIYKKKFEYAELFNHQLLSMQQFGLKEKFVKKLDLNMRDE